MSTKTNEADRAGKSEVDAGIEGKEEKWDKTGRDCAEASDNEY